MRNVKQDVKHTLTWSLPSLEKLSQIEFGESPVTGTRLKISPQLFLTSLMFELAILWVRGSFCQMHRFQCFVNNY